MGIYKSNCSEEAKFQNFLKNYEDGENVPLDSSSQSSDQSNDELNDNESVMSSDESIEELGDDVEENSSINDSTKIDDKFISLPIGSEVHSVDDSLSQKGKITTKKVLKRAHDEAFAKSKTPLDAIQKKDQSNKTNKKPRWKGRLSVYVNQLPYDVTEDEVKAHFSGCLGKEEELEVRFIIHKKAKCFKGVAFLDWPSQESYEKCFALHHSTLMAAKSGSSRVINVQRTVERSDGAQKGLEKAFIAKNSEEMISSAIAKNKLKKGDVDARAMEFLKSVPADVALTAIKDFSELDKSNIDNRASFFMGLLLRRLRNPSGKEGNKGGRTGGRGGRRGGRSGGRSDNRGGQRGERSNKRGYQSGGERHSGQRDGGSSGRFSGRGRQRGGRFGGRGAGRSQRGGNVQKS